MGLSNWDITQLINWARDKGYKVRYHNHPKTRANWAEEPARKKQ